MSFLKEAFDWLKTNTNKDPITFALGSETHVINPMTGAAAKAQTERNPLRHEFGTVKALCAYMKRENDVNKGAGSLTTVIVSPTGIVARLDESQPGYRTDVLKVPFFQADMPPQHDLSHDALLLYLDQQAGNVEQEKEIRAALSIVKVMASADVTSKDIGAGTRIEAKVSKEVTTGSGEAVTLPKYITIRLRIGTREYEEFHRFRLFVTTDDKNGVRFRLVHLDRDGAVDRFMQRCIADLEAELGGACVFQGA